MIRKPNRNISGVNIMLDDLNEVTIDQIALTNMYSREALVNVLEMKGPLTKQELLAEIQNIKEEHESKKNEATEPALL
jgi:hypothetical protein